MKNKTSLNYAQKKALIARTRQRNYRASLRLEGYSEVNANPSASRNEIIARYRELANHK